MKCSAIKLKHVIYKEKVFKNPDTFTGSTTKSLYKSNTIRRTSINNIPSNYIMIIRASEKSPYKISKKQG